MDNTKLIKDVDSLIEDAENNKHNFDEAINWGDLSCRDVEKVESHFCGVFYRVLIEEASPSCTEFRSFISTGLEKMGYKNIEVVTEW